MLCSVFEITHGHSEYLEVKCRYSGMVIARLLDYSLLLFTLRPLVLRPNVIIMYLMSCNQNNITFTLWG